MLFRSTSEAAHLRTTASHTLMGDGTLIVESGKSDYDDALVTLEKGTLSEAEINDVVANADTAGLIGPERDYDQPNVTDMSTTWVTIAVDDTTYGQSAYALYFTENDDDLSPAVQKRRVQLRDFIEDLDEIADDTVDYVPDAIVVYRMSVDQDPEPENAKAWPIATAPPEPTGSGTCIVVEGDEAYALAEAVEDAHAGDLWQVGTDAPTQFAMRPMLPGDEGCKR